MGLPQSDEAAAGFNTLVLVGGLLLVVIVIVLGYREYRIREHKRRAATTRLMIGSFDLYNPVDRLKVNGLISDLYQIYIESHQACDITLENTPEQLEAFVQGFALPYLQGKIDLSGLPKDVAAVFRIKHYEYVLQHKSA